MKQLTQNARRVFLVLGALDECPDADDQSRVSGIIMINPTCTNSSFAQVFVTFWPHVDLSQVLKHCLKVEIFAHDSDM